MTIFSADEIRKWDKFTIANEPISSIDLMERAATACTAWLTARYSVQTIHIFCGKGNNGGDGLAIARQLLQKQYKVQVYIIESPYEGSSNFEINLQRHYGLNQKVQWLNPAQALPQINTNDLTIDALFGTGLSKPVTGFYAAVIDHINSACAMVIAIDMPSGLFADSSSKNNTVIKATHTLTFQQMKVGLLLPENEAFIGAVHVLAIGLHPGYQPVNPPPYQLVDKEMIASIYRPRNRFGHKGTFGHGLVVGGKKGTMGACILSAKSCLHSGCGLVTAAVPRWGLPIMQTAFPEAMAISFSSLRKAALDKFSAIGFGPGLGTGNTAQKLMHSVLEHSTKPLVIDADGLNILSQNPSWLSQLPAQSILTPHPKEFERLFGTAENSFAVLTLAMEKANALNCILLVKGHHTFIAAPGGAGYFNNTGNSGMATGGSGDVLTGIITGLLCQGYLPLQATLLGVYLHGFAGDIAMQEKGQEALVASDLITWLGKAFLQVPAK